MGAGWARIEEMIANLDAGKEVSVAARRLSDGREWLLDAERICRAASTIKTPILVAVFRAVDEGHLALEDRWPIDPKDRVIGSGVLSWLSPDLGLSLRDHAYLMIAISDNTASNVMISAAGEERIRGILEDLGMTGTTLGRRFLGRVPGPEEGENFTTAADLVRVMAAIAEDRAASPESCAAMRSLLALQQDSDALGRRLPGGISFAGKSGWMEMIRHDSGLLTGPNGTLAIAVTTTGISDRHEADELIGQVAAAVVVEAGIA
jgi:beta-lactamase class A